jgi:hypothetical protein
VWAKRAVLGLLRHFSLPNRYKAVAIKFLLSGHLPTFLAIFAIVSVTNAHKFGYLPTS